MNACITPTSCSAKLGGMYTSVGSAGRDRLHARVAEIAGSHLREIGERHLGLLDLGMPPLLPFEAVEALVAHAGQRLDLLLHRYLATTGEDVLPAVARRDGVLEVGV